MKIGIIINPYSKKNKKNNCAAIDIFKKIGGDYVEVFATKSFDDLDNVIKDLKKRKINYIGISGGDGTIHHVLTNIINNYLSGEIPPILLLGDGTMNNIATSIGMNGNSNTILKKFIKEIKNNKIINTDLRDTIKINDHYCSLFGFGFVSNMLNSIYEGGKKDTKKILKVLAKAFAETFTKDQKKLKLFRPVNAEVLIDNEKIKTNEIVAALAGTVESVGMGFTTLYKANEEKRKFHLLISGVKPKYFIKNIRKLKVGKEIKLEDHYDRLVSELIIRSEKDFEYTMDGDMYKTDGELIVRIGPTIDFVVLK